MLLNVLIETTPPPPPHHVSCLTNGWFVSPVGVDMWPATAAAPLHSCNRWPLRTAGTSPPIASCWGSCLLSLAPIPTKLYVTFCRLQMKSSWQRGGSCDSRSQCSSFSCLSGVQQQLPSCCTDEAAEGKHTQASPGAHARAAHGSVGGVTHLVGPVTMVLQGGPRSVVSVNKWQLINLGLKGDKGHLWKEWIWIYLNQETSVLSRMGRAIQRSLSGWEHRQWHLLMFSPRIFYFYRHGTWFCKNLSIHNRM